MSIFMVKKMNRGLLLLSGGIDSPVAGKIMLNKNFEVCAVHFSQKDIVGEETIIKCQKLAKLLNFKDLIIEDISQELINIAQKSNPKFYFVLMKRLMLRKAEKLAKKLNCQFLITGENIGQVSSQTSSNLYIINQASKMPILRPLACLDKVEIIEMAKKFNTFEISNGPEVCDALGPKHPATQSSKEIILKEEAKYILS